MEAGERVGREEKREEEAASLGRNLRSGMPSRCHVLFVRSMSRGPAPTYGVEASSSGGPGEPFSKVACPYHKWTRQLQLQLSTRKETKWGENEESLGDASVSWQERHHRREQVRGPDGKKGPVCEHPGPP